MAVNIKNISKDLVSFRLNSGEYFHLSPSGILEDINESEVERNKPLSKLVKRKRIVMTQGAKKNSVSKKKESSKEKVKKQNKKK